MNLENRIHAEGNAALSAFKASPDLTDRITARTRRRAKQRRQRASAGIALGTIAVIAGGLAVVNRSTNTPKNVLVAATQVDTTEPAIAPTTNAPSVAAAPTSFFSIDPFANTGVEHDLDGNVLRTFSVTPVAADSERLLTAAGEVVLGGKPGTLGMDDDPSCQNRKLTFGGEMNPSLPQARVASMASVAGSADGILYTARAVCPPGTAWGDAGTGWELVKLDMNYSAGRGMAEVLSFYAADAEATDPSAWLNPAYYSPHKFKITPDGLAAIVSASRDGLVEDIWMVIPLERPSKVARLDTCTGSRPSYLGDGRFAWACREYDDQPFIIQVRDLNGEVLSSTLMPVMVPSSETPDPAPSQILLSGAADPADPLHPYVLVTQVVDITATSTSLIVKGVEVPLPEVTGVAAWSLAEIGYTETYSGTLPALPVGPPPDGTAPASPVVTGESDATITIRFDSELTGTQVEPIVDLVFAVAAPGSADPSYPIYRFSGFGTGTMVAVDPGTGVVMRANIDGRTHRNVIPVDDPAGLIWDVALGAEDYDPPNGLDPMLYVTRSLTDADGLQTFTLVAYGLSNDPDNELVNEFGRWPTNWGCYETSCGNIVFTGTGVDVGSQIVSAAGPTFKALPTVKRTPAGLSDGANDVCVDDKGYGFYAAFRDEYILNSTAWTIEVQCTYVAEGEFSYRWPQIDGSVLVSLAVSRRSSDTPRNVIVRLDPNGTANAFESKDYMSQFTWSAGRLYGIAAPLGSTIQLVELVPVTP